MMKEKDIEIKLGRVFDAMPLEQLSETLNNIQLEPLSSDSEQRIKDMVKEKMRKENLNVKGKKKSKRWIAAAAALVFTLTGTVIFNADDVKAELSRLFGFVPGVGVVEVEHEDSTVVQEEQNTNADKLEDATTESSPVKATKWYLLENANATTSDDMIQVELMDAAITGEKLEVRYTVNLLQISDDDVNAAFSKLNSGDMDAFENMYLEKGYDKYFDLAGAASFQLVPHSSMVMNSNTVEAIDTVAQGVESMEGIREICVSEVYNIADVLNEEDPTGVLSIAGLDLEFGMKNLELVSSPDDLLKSSVVTEMHGIKVLCVPTWNADKVQVEFYTLDSGDYENVTGFQLFETDQCVLKVNEKTLENCSDYSYVFDKSNSAYIGRCEYDVSEIGGDITSAIVQTSGLVANKVLENKKIDLTSAIAEGKALNEVIDIDGAKFEFVEASSRAFESSADYHYSEHGMLVLKYKMDSTDEDKMFMFFDEIKINGQKMEGYSTEWVDDTYINMMIPLSMPYSEVTSIEFGKAQYQLSGTMEFDITNTK